MKTKLDLINAIQERVSRGEAYPTAASTVLEELSKSEACTICRSNGIAVPKMKAEGWCTGAHRALYDNLQRFITAPLFRARENTVYLHFLPSEHGNGYLAAISDNRPWKILFAHLRGKARLGDIYGPQAVAFAREVMEYFRGLGVEVFETLEVAA